MKFVVICLVFLAATANAILAQSFENKGKASFYANKFEGKTTASGEKYRHDLLTAAHKSLPFGTLVKVTNISNGKTVVVRINDRGPFIEERIIDVSKSAAVALDFINDGITVVTLEIVTDESQGQENTLDAPENNLPIIENEEILLVQAPPVESTAPNEVVQPAPKTAPVPLMSTTYYQIKAEKSTPKGFGLQIASYQESGNLLERASAVESELQQKVTIQVVNSNGNRVYRLIVGEFDTRAKAEYFKDSIKGTYPGFVVTF
jgi:rare lipoprotein A